MHILPQLRKLEDRYRDSMVVIGVHSAKFSTEKTTANIAGAVSRYNVRHPVVNDANFDIWRHYGLRAWPTLMFIDPEGRVIGRHEGEFAVGDLDRVIQQMLGEFEAAGTLKKGLLPFQERAVEEERRALAFPGKIEADPATGRLLIADSNHHRVLVTGFDGEVQRVIGNGEFGEPRFSPQPLDGPVLDNPQGMAADGDILYIADAGLHSILKADLGSGTIETIAGTGQQSLFRHNGGGALDNPLSSPFDIGLQDGILYIAMAGFHQLWAMNLDGGTIEPFAGTGIESISDGTRDEALLAQPTGLSVSGNNVFFTDSETSSARLAKIGKGGRVVTLVGTGLFDFGDAEGIGKQAMLQHAQGIASGRDVLYIADTYNHRIKQLSLATLRVSNLAGSGRKGTADGPAKSAAFNEPAGVAVAGNSVFVADTNNHSIRVIDTAEGRVSTLDLSGLPA